MSSHYLIDLFSDTITEKVLPQGTPARSVVTGNYVIRVPNDVVVREPTGRDDLIAQKYAGLLSNYTDFTQVAYDEMIDGSGVDLANSHGVTSGSRGMVSIYPTNAGYGAAPVLQTAPLSITWGGGGGGPSQTLITYELFEYVDVDEKGAPYIRMYREVPTDADVAVSVSFNGGADFNPIVDRVLVGIAGPERGTSIVLKFVRSTNIAARGRLFLGSWAALF